MKDSDVLGREFIVVKEVYGEGGIRVVVDVVVWEFALFRLGFSDYRVYFF